MSDITEEDVMKYCQSRNLMLVTKESLEYMHRPIVIENAPTVEAIPIEWIEKYLEPYKEHFNKLSDKSKETSGAGWVIDVLESMLREWEKENANTN